MPKRKRTDTIRTHNLAQARVKAAQRQLSLESQAPQLQEEAGGSEVKLEKFGGDGVEQMEEEMDSEGETTNNVEVEESPSHQSYVKVEGEDSPHLVDEGLANDQGEDWEVPVNLQKKLARVTPRNHPKDTATSILRPRSFSPSPLFCFVCVTTPGRSCPKVTGADFYCLMTDMIGLSPRKSRSYLDQLKKPEKYIGLCVKCLNVIREAAKLREKIKELEKGLKRCQGEIVTKMNSIRLKSAVETKKTCPTGNQEERLVIKNILSFVHNRKYNPVLASRPSSSSNITTLTRVKQDRQRVRDKKASKPLSTIMDTETGTPIETCGTDNDVCQDPLSFDNSGQEDEADLEQTEAQVSRTPSPSHPQSKPVRLHIKLHRSSSHVYYCGLCDDDQVYTSEEQLQLHTNKIHRPPLAHQNLGTMKNKKRRRKQRFSSGSDSDEEVGDDPTISTPIPSEISEVTSMASTELMPRQYWNPHQKS